MWNIKKSPPLTSLKKRERKRLLKIVDYLRVAIKIICAEFEIIVMVETFFSGAWVAFLLKNKLDFAKMGIMYASLFP